MIDQQSEDFGKFALHGKWGTEIIFVILSLIYGKMGYRDNFKRNLKSNLSENGVQRSF